MESTELEVQTDEDGKCDAEGYFLYRSGKCDTRFCSTGPRLDFWREDIESK